VETRQNTRLAGFLFFGEMMAIANGTSSLFSASNFVARDPDTGVRLYSVRRLDSRFDTQSFYRAENRLRVAVPPALALNAVRPGYDAFRNDVTGVRPYGDPPPPYAHPGQVPEVLPPGPPPPYSAEDAWQSHFVRPSAPPPDDEQTAISRYLDAGHPRSDV